MNAITNAYNHYLTTYAPKSTRSRSSAHKQSELKDIYNSIVKKSKESPTYLFDQTKSVYKYAVSIKEEAIGLQDALTALTNKDDPGSIIGRKIANSSDSDTVNVSYIGNNLSVDSDTSFDLEVSNLAKPQINTGKFLNPDKLKLLPNDYSFELQTSSAAYEFQFHVSHNDTNKSIQTRLANLINNSDIALSANVITDENNRTALQITSSHTGRPANGSDTLFSIEGLADRTSDDIVNYLGIDNTTQLSEDAVFRLNGEMLTSESNNFTLNNTFELNVKQLTEENQPVHIGFKTDTDTIADNIKSLIGQYNSMVDTTGQYTTDNRVQSHSLLKELNSTTSIFHNSLESIGLNIEDNGKISVDDSLLYQALEEDTEETVQSIFNFKSALINKTDKILLDPMEYVNKTIVTYKNPGKTFVNPYVTSMYSGMLFNSYC